MVNKYWICTKQALHKIIQAIEISGKIVLKQSVNWLIHKGKYVWCSAQIVEDYLSPDFAMAMRRGGVMVDV